MPGKSKNISTRERLKMAAARGRKNFRVVSRDLSDYLEKWSKDSGIELQKYLPRFDESEKLDRALQKTMGERFGEFQKGYLQRKDNLIREGSKCGLTALNAIRFNRKKDVKTHSESEPKFKPKEALPEEKTPDLSLANRLIQFFLGAPKKESGKKHIEAGSPTNIITDSGAHHPKLNLDTIQRGGDDISQSKISIYREKRRDKFAYLSRELKALKSNYAGKSPTESDEDESPTKNGKHFEFNR